jgi:hypothetical protein
MQKTSEELGIPFHEYDIDDPDQVIKADELVRKFGDWSDDYFVPQVFAETKNGEIHHVLTGYSESLELTERAVDNLLSSPLFTTKKVNQGHVE